jgi:hypothetical protein
MLWNGGGMDRRTRGFVVVLCWVGLMLGHSRVENNVSFQSQIGLSQSVCHVSPSSGDHSNETKNYVIRRCWCHRRPSTPFFVVMQQVTSNKNKYIHIRVLGTPPLTTYS